VIWNAVPAAHTVNDVLSVAKIALYDVLGVVIPLRSTPLRKLVNE
jgi:hypothetical protein